MRHSPWPHRDKELIEHHAEGKTWRQISDGMRLSLNAVKSRGHEIGLNNRAFAHSHIPPPRNQPRPKKERQPWQELPRDRHGYLLPSVRTLPPLRSLQEDD